MRIRDERDGGLSGYAAVLAAEFIALMGFAASTPVIPSFLRELGIRDEARLKLWSGLSNAHPSVMIALFSPIWGAIADSRGRKPMLLRALFGSSLFIGLIALAGAPWQLLALRTLQGCVTGTVAAATVLVAASAPEGAVGRRLGLLQSAIFMGNSIGPVIGGRAAELLGNRASFAIASALLASGGVIVAAFVKENFRRSDPVTAALSGGRASAAPAAIAWASLIPLFSVVFAFQLAGSNVTPILPLYVEDLMGDPRLVRSVSGLIIGSVGVASAVSAGIGGRLSDAFGPGRVLVVTLACAAILELMQAFAHSPWTLLAYRAGAGLFLGGTMPSINALIAKRPPPRQTGKVFGVSGSVGQASASLGPLMGAGISIVSGYRTVFYATSGLLAILSVGIAFNTRKRAGKEAAGAR